LKGCGLWLNWRVTLLKVADEGLVEKHQNADTTLCITMWKNVKTMMWKMQYMWRQCYVKTALCEDSVMWRQCYVKETRLIYGRHNSCYVIHYYIIYLIYSSWITPTHVKWYDAIFCLLFASRPYQQETVF